MKFIQFMHPSWEHGFKSKNGDIFPNKQWNKLSHKRKFVKQSGFLLDSLNDTPKESDIDFWCEWEPNSIVEKELETNINLSRIKSNYTGLPKFLHGELFYSKLDSNLGRKNTDPCVFGKTFKFFLCQQTRKKSKKNPERIQTQLAKLEKGSIILFGSHKQNSKTKERLFIVDTVFVVDDWIEFYSKEDFKNINDTRICKGYKDICINFLDKLPITRRLYFGATYENQVNGMFSFVPCKKSGNNYGFERPVIILKDRVNSNRNTGFKQSTINNIDESKAIWNNIVKQIFKQDLKIGWGFKMPKQRTLLIPAKFEYEPNSKETCPISYLFTHSPFHHLPF
ncbi:hypothetical protein [Sunxiuqinia elliptica]|uniref:Uncharacterized protein n=1 Tax=Sunxiuqinia elliptica TaxID=655355 RepID=A0A1I2BG80_9BACT|nr:hypothetical protein [Sunxiuqinia elliptica]SFE54140.1 hypothetical protein SAMN05216283_101385 [Sunxiuqinia elliptica]